MARAIASDDTDLVIDLSEVTMEAATVAVIIRGSSIPSRPVAVFDAAIPLDPRPARQTSKLYCSANSYRFGESRKLGNWSSWGTISSPGKMRSENSQIRWRQVAMRPSSPPWSPAK